MQIIKIVVPVINIMLGLLMLYFGNTQKSGDTRNFSTILAFLYFADAILILN